MTAAAQVRSLLADELASGFASIATITGTGPVSHQSDRIRILADDLLGDDPHRGRLAAADVMTVLRWHHKGDPPPEWWNTPVGRLVARWINPGAGSVTHDEAARMLGVSRGAVSQMVHRGVRGKGGSGGLERHPAGGVTRASVMARIARLSRAEQH